MEVKDPKSLATSIEGRHVAWRADYGSDSSNSMWIAAKKYIEDAVVESQPKSSVAKRQHWMTEDTWHLVEDRRKLKASGASITELNARSAIIQTACRRDRNNHLGKICDELEQHSDNYQTKDLHDKVRYITRQFKPKTWAIEDSVGTTVTEIKDIVNVWKEYCKSLFFSNGVPSFTCSPRQILDREPNIMRDEVRAAIKHLKCNKAMGCDEIPIEVFKAMGESGVDVLFTICNKIWETDFRKAFDTVIWAQLWRILAEMGVPPHLIVLLRRLYESGTAAVRVDGTLSENFKTEAGVRQGCILSPLLFNTYTEYIMRIVLEEWDRGISVGGRVINNLRYADDTTLLAQTKEDMENLLTRLETTSLKFGLSINREKTKMMIVDRAEQIRTNVQSIANCEVVQSYIYLGSTISSTGGCSDEIRRRCAITRNENSMERLVVQGQVEGRRARGRSPTRWTDLIKKATESTMVQCTRNASNRQKWKHIAKRAVLERVCDPPNIFSCTSSAQPRPL
ncbi:uncharacterized protein [Choristoneura fumiferana]|uniref:uncharacterized protein n=1 Tax=Choristoneura fumiferana TaxID=7141 RepID=UPI003D1546ED